MSKLLIPLLGGILSLAISPSPTPEGLCCRPAYSAYPLGCFTSCGQPSCSGNANGTAEPGKCLTETRNCQPSGTVPIWVYPYYCANNTNYCDSGQWWCYWWVAGTGWWSTVAQCSGDICTAPPG
jgi:hypothetical protein